MSTTPELPENDPRQDPEFAVLWGAMAEADWIDLTGEEDSPQLRELLAAHRRLVVPRRNTWILLAVVIGLAGAVGLLTLLL